MMDETKLKSGEIHEPEPQKWGSWNEMAGGEVGLFAGGQKWIKTDTTVEIEQ